MNDPASIYNLAMAESNGSEHDALQRLCAGIGGEALAQRLVIEYGSIHLACKAAAALRARKKDSEKV